MVANMSREDDILSEQMEPIETKSCHLTVELQLCSTNPNIFLLWLSNCIISWSRTYGLGMKG